MNFGLGPSATFGFQVLAVDGDGNLALLAVQGGGMGSTGGSANVTAWKQISNAPSVAYPRNGVTVFAGGSAALGPGLGLDAMCMGRDPSGGYRFGAQVSVELGAAGSPLTVAEFHGGGYKTSDPLVAFNVYDLLGVPRPSER